MDIRGIPALVLMLVLCCPLAGCDKAQRLIEDVVVNESGIGLDGASVTACYSDWGWSNGSPVWDKDYCSAPVLTDYRGAF